MFYNTNEEEAEVPSWLQEENDSKPKEQMPLLGSKNPKPKLPKSSSSGSSSHVEVDYGGNSFYDTPSIPSSTLVGNSFSYGITDTTAAAAAAVVDGGEVDTSWANEPSATREHADSEDSDSSSSYEDTDDDDEDEESDGDKTPKAGGSSDFEKKKTRTSKHWSDENNISDTTKQKKNKSRGGGSSNNKKYADMEYEGFPTRPPRRGCCHSIFVFVQILAVLANLSMIATQIVPIFIADIGLLQEVVRVYLALFSFIFLLIEVEVPFLRNSQALQNWMSRGFLYSFLAVVSMEQHEAMVQNGSLHHHHSTASSSENTIEKDISFAFSFNIEWAMVFIKVSSWWMLGLGCLYFVFGMCCMKRVRGRCREQYANRLKVYKEAVLERENGHQRRNSTGSSSNVDGLVV